MLSIICKVSFTASYTAHTSSTGVVGTRTRGSEDQDLIKLGSDPQYYHDNANYTISYTFTHHYVIEMVQLLGTHLHFLNSAQIGENSVQQFL